METNTERKKGGSK